MQLSFTKIWYHAIPYSRNNTIQYHTIPYNTIQNDAMLLRTCGLEWVRWFQGRVHSGGSISHSQTHSQSFTAHTSPTSTIWTCAPPLRYGTAVVVCMIFSRYDECTSLLHGIVCLCNILLTKFLNRSLIKYFIRSITCDLKRQKLDKPSSIPTQQPHCHPQCTCPLHPSRICLPRGLMPCKRSWHLSGIVCPSHAPITYRNMRNSSRNRELMVLV